MAVISWHNERDGWVVAGWAFRQLLEDVRSECPTDPEIVSELERARDLKYRFIDSFNGELAKRLADAIRDTASGIPSGRIRSGLLDKPYGTANAIAEYRNSMQELVAVISRTPGWVGQ
jgi:hypothetical protein